MSDFLFALLFDPIAIVAWSFACLVATVLLAVVFDAMTED